MSQTEDQAEIDKEIARLSLYDVSRQLVELMVFREELLTAEERQALDVASLAVGL